MFVVNMSRVLTDDGVSDAGLELSQTNKVNGCQVEISDMETQWKRNFTNC